MYVILVVLLSCTIGNTIIPKIEYVVKKPKQEQSESEAMNIARKEFQRCEEVKIERIGIMSP